jgi:hypothetical protein
MRSFVVAFSEYLYLAPNFDGSVWAGEIYSLSIYKSVITNNSPLELLTKSQEDYLSQLVDHSYQNCPPENRFSLLALLLALPGSAASAFVFFHLVCVYVCLWVQSSPSSSGSHLQH